MFSCSNNDLGGEGFDIRVESDVILNDTLILTRYSTAENNFHDTLGIALLNEGRADLKGIIDVPCMARIRFKQAKKGLSIFLDNSTMKVTVNAENLLDATMKGTPVQSNGIHGVIQEAVESSPAYNDGMVRFLGLATELKRLSGSEKDSVNASIIRRLRDKAWFDIIYAQRAVYQTIVDTATDIRLTFLLQLSDRFYDKSGKDSLLNTYMANYGEDYNVQLYRKRESLAAAFLETSNLLKIGNKFKDFTIRDIGGDSLRLSDVVGQNKVVLLEFWASWCSPCRAEIPHLNESYIEYKPKGFEIFSVSVDDSEKAWRKASEASGIKYINTSDLKGLNGEISKLYGIDKSGIPMNLLLDNDGRIIQKDIHSDALPGVLEKLLSGS